VAVGSLRRETAQRVATLDKQLRTTDDLDALVEEILLNGKGRLAWIQVWESRGTVMARAGTDAAPTFSVQLADAKFRQQQPLYALRNTDAGEILVEAFPIRLPKATSAIRLVATSGVAMSGVRPLGVIEVASFFNPGPASWPLLRNLIVSTLGALALLASVLVMMLRFRSYASGKRTEQQLEIARRVQQDLLPSPGALVQHFDLAADWQTAARVGGDFYDAFEIPGKGSALVFGDVSGKDIPAAILTGVVHGAVRSSSWTRSAAEHNDATTQLNRLLCENASRERFVSMVWSYFDPQTQLLHYVNAGHCPPLLFRTSGHGPSPLRLTGGGPVLGLLQNATFEQDVERLEPGDLVVFYSDGIIEATAAGGEEFGEERLVAEIERNLGADASEIRDRILLSLRAFTNRKELEDDQTLVVVRYQGLAASQVEREAVALAA